jgi:tRNA threonylcarbamoyladenosine biosynthesis protein TsaB
MKLLAIDTSTEACSCALHIAGDIRQRNTLAPRQHAELILSMADELLKEAHLQPQQLDGLAFGCGPGSFTGLRIACGVIQGIAFATDLPVAPISSLAALAQATSEKHVLTAIDARMNEIYWGYYTRDAQGIMRLIGAENVSAPQQVKLITESGWYGVGSGWTRYADELMAHLGNTISDYQGDRYPQAHAIIPLALTAFHEGRIVNAHEALPVYLRNKVV